MDEIIKELKQLNKTMESLKQFTIVNTQISNKILMEIKNIRRKHNE